jgi:hypothetical protein
MMYKLIIRLFGRHPSVFKHSDPQKEFHWFGKHPTDSNSRALGLFFYGRHPLDSPSTLKDSERLVILSTYVMQEQAEVTERHDMLGIDIERPQIHFFSAIIVTSHAFEEEP